MIFKIDTDDYSQPWCSTLVLSQLSYNRIIYGKLISYTVTEIMYQCICRIMNIYLRRYRWGRQQTHTHTPHICMYTTIKGAGNLDRQNRELRYLYCEFSGCWVAISSYKCTYIIAQKFAWVWRHTGFRTIVLDYSAMECNEAFCQPIYIQSCLRYDTPIFE